MTNERSRNLAIAIISLVLIDTLFVYFYIQDYKNMNGFNAIKLLALANLLFIAFRLYIERDRS